MEVLGYGRLDLHVGMGVGRGRGREGKGWVGRRRERVAYA